MLLSKEYVCYLAREVTKKLIAAEFIETKTHSGFEIAPLPFDATADDVVISKSNQYNPFGLDFGGLTLPNSNYRTRFVTLGDRKSKSDSDTKLTNIGLKGTLPFKDWQWDLNLGYNRENLLLFRVNTTPGGSKGAAITQFHQELLERISAIPGLRGVQGELRATS